MSLHAHEEPAPLGSGWWCVPYPEGRSAADIRRATTDDGKLSREYTSMRGALGTATWFRTDPRLRPE
jgi:hypothetical protein